MKKEPMHMSDRNWVQRITGQLRPGPQLGYDLVRAYLGIGLFVRGVLFVSNPDLVMGYLEDIDGWFLPYAMVHYVAIAHLCGGVMLAAGLATRFAAAIQLPVLGGAVFLVHSSGGLLASGQSLEFSGLVFALLFVYLTFGAGRISVDSYLRTSSFERESHIPSLVPPAPLRSEVLAAQKVVS